MSNVACWFLSRGERTLLRELRQGYAPEAGASIAVDRTLPALQRLLSKGMIAEDQGGRLHLQEAVLSQYGRARAWRLALFTLVLVAVARLLSWMYSPMKAIVILAILLAADQVFLHLESRGLMNYRRVGLSRGAATYHTLQLSAVFDPGFAEVQDVKYAVERQADDSGAPPPADDAPTE